MAAAGDYRCHHRPATVCQARCVFLSLYCSAQLMDSDNEELLGWGGCVGGDGALLDSPRYVTRSMVVCVLCVMCDV